MKKDMPLEGLRWSRDSGSALYDTPQNGRSRTGWGGDFSVIYTHISFFLSLYFFIYIYYISGIILLNGIRPFVTQVPFAITYILYDFPLVRFLNVAVLVSPAFIVPMVL